MRFSIADLFQNLRRMLGPAHAGEAEEPAVGPEEVEQAAEDRLQITEEERAAAQKAARDVMERVRRERGDSPGNS